MAKRKKTLEGFGSPTTTSGQGNLAATMKNLGKMLSNKGIRPVGGNVTGVTSGGKAASGDIKLKPIGGKGIAGGGQGPKEMPQMNTGMKTSDLGSMGKSGLGKKDVRVQPD